MAMRLDFASEDPRISKVVAQLIDLPLRVVDGERLEGHVWLDGRSFINCTFVNPHFHTRTGHFGWRDNSIDGAATTSVYWSNELPLAFAVNTRGIVEQWLLARGGKRIR